MKRLKSFLSSKKGIIIAAIIILLISFRIALPYIVKNYVNKVLNEIPGYTGEVGDVNIHLWRGAYEITDFSLVKTNGKIPVPFFSSKSADISLEWSAIFDGSLVGKIILTDPKLNFVAGPSPKETQKTIDTSWTDRVKELFPLKINHFEIKDGVIHFRNYYSDPKVDIFLDNLQVAAENLTNSKKLSKTLMAKIDAKGTAMSSGKFILHTDIDPYAKYPTFYLKSELKNVDLVKLNNFIKAYAKFDVEKGTFELAGEFAAADGKFTGYVKPFFKDMQILSIKKDIKNPLKLFWEAIAGAVTGLFTNKKNDQFAARIPFNGNFKNPSAGIWAAIGSILENAFIKALAPNIEGSVNIKQLEK